MYQAIVKGTAPRDGGASDPFSRNTCSAVRCVRLGWREARAALALQTPRFQLAQPDLMRARFHPLICYLLIS
jgi:hypothetical protein